MAVEKINKRNVIVIDSANLAFRYVHTFKGVPIQYGKNSQIYSGVVYGMLEAIWRMVDTFRAVGVIFVFEGKHENNPRRKHPVYKSKRATSFSVDITAELTLIRELITLLGCFSIIPLRGEADDGIAHVTRKLRKDYNVIICSMDHDMQVLLGPSVKILKKPDGNGLYSHKDFIDDNGFDPRLFSLFMAVCGDSSDSIPGVSGIGPKKAAIIFKDYKVRADDNNSYKLASYDIASKLKELYPSTCKGSVDEIDATIREFYNLTKIRKNWPIAIYPPVYNGDFSIVKEVFETFKLMQFINKFNEIKKKTIRLTEDSVDIRNILRKE